MASITINPVTSKPAQNGTISGGEHLIVIDRGGKPSVIPIDSILDKIDDNIVDRIDDQILDKVEDQIDDIIDDRLENIDPTTNLKWNEVL